MPENFLLPTPENPAPPVFEQHQQEAPENTRVEHLEDATGSTGAQPVQEEVKTPEPLPQPEPPAPKEAAQEPAPTPEQAPVIVPEPDIAPDPEEVIAFKGGDASDADLENEAAMLARLRQE